MGTDKDKAYIYVQKKKLVIDLCIDANFAEQIKQAGFQIKPRENFQGQIGWLTGWHVPHQTKNIDAIMHWLCMAFV